jgi:5'-methylthioadenosine phosphorylase
MHGDSLPSDGQTATIGVIGGSGLYDLFGEGEQREIAVVTPYGGPVALTIGQVAGRAVAFVARHGKDHSVPPHRLNARATMWAMASVGVRTVVATAAVGSLNAALPIGSLAIADQLVDRTHGRADTYFDGSLVRHLPFSDPWGSALRAIAVQACPDVADGATVLVIQGPRFSTRAESRINRDTGIDLVNMTLYPEVALAAEIGIDTVALCVVTDVDSGESADEAVTADDVFARLAEARPKLISAIERIVAAVPLDYAARRLIDHDAVNHVMAGRVQ